MHPSTGSTAILTMKITSTTCACVLLAAVVRGDKGVIPSTVSGPYTIGPTYKPDPATDQCLDCERGQTFELFMPVKDSAYYNCDPNDNPYLNWTCYADGDCGQEFGTPGTRNLTVYIPAGYEDNGNEVAVMVTQDHFGVESGEFPKITNIMDSLINAQDDERSLPFFVLVAVQLAGPGAYGASPCGGSIEGSVRSYEYQTFSTEYSHFVADEVLPFVTNHPDIKTKYPNLSFTNDPAGRASFGISDGGATAIKMAFFTPSLFGIAIGYNAGLVDHRFPSQPSKLEYPKGFAGKLKCLFYKAYI